MRRIVVLISNKGSGSNLQALIDNQATGFNGQIVAVFSSKPDAYGLVRAKEADIPTEVVDYSDHRRRGLPRTAFDKDLAYKIQRYSPDLIVLAGWMLILSNEFLRFFPWRVINLHPGLLPDKGKEQFRLPNGQFADPCVGLAGENAIKAVLAAGQPYAGSTVHAVIDEEADTGPVIKRGMVEVKPEDTVETLYERLKGKEHEIMVDAVRELCWVPSWQPAKS